MIRHLALAASIVLSVTAPASAALITVTASGTIEYGMQFYTVSGAPRKDITTYNGNSFTAQFLIDTEVGFAVGSPNVGRQGNSFDANSPVVSATLNLNGTQYSWGSSGFLNTSAISYISPSSNSTYYTVQRSEVSSSDLMSLFFISNGFPTAPSLPLYSTPIGPVDPNTFSLINGFD
jgi:hypothetical protein